MTWFLLRWLDSCCDVLRTYCMFNLQMLTTVCCSAHLFPAMQQPLTMTAVMRGMTMVILTLLERKSCWHSRRWNSCPRIGFSVTKWAWLHDITTVYRASLPCTWKKGWKDQATDIHCLHMHVQLPEFFHGAWRSSEKFSLLLQISQFHLSERYLTLGMLCWRTMRNWRNTQLLACKNCSYVYPFYI